MSKVHKFSDSKTIRDEAWQWLIKLDGDHPLSAEERAALGEWLGRSPAHRDSLTEQAQFWDKLNVLTELSVPQAKPVAHHVHRDARRGWWPGFAAAAAVVLLVVIFVPNLWTGPDHSTNGGYFTGIGEQKTIVLADGSSITLNTNSRVKVSYAETTRDISLEQGEAYFAVESDRARAFRVFVGDSLVQAVGTAFTVRLRDTEVDVTVAEGKVALATQLPATTAVIEQIPVATGDAATTGEQRLGLLTAGQKATIKNGASLDALNPAALAPAETLEQAELEREIAWQQGLLLFSGEPLSEVVDTIARYTTVSLEISDPAVRGIRVGGQIEVGEIEEMLSALETGFGLEVQRIADDRVRIRATSYR